MPLAVHLTALGCRLNEAERDAWAVALHRGGAQLVDRPAVADIVVLNTCAVTAKAARTSRKRARALRREAPGATLVVTGCAATLDPDGVPEADTVIPNADKDTLAQQILAAHPAEDPIGLLPTRHRRTRRFVKVQDGCRNRCTFCIVTVARGAERSRPLVEVVDEVRRAVEGGALEVVLTGVHLGGFGEEHGTDLATLVDALLSETELPRLRIGSLEPWKLTDALTEAIRHPRLCPHLHLPLQSGSRAVLKRMARRGTPSDFLRRLEQLRTVRSDLLVTTDIIAGFPGETDQDHAATCALLGAAGLSGLHVFPFSAREGTAAARMPGQLPHAIVRQRAADLRALDAHLRGAALQAAVGTSRPVLWERHGGLTDTFLPVLPTNAPPNSLEVVELVGVRDGALVARA